MLWNLRLSHISASLLARCFLMVGIGESAIQLYYIYIYGCKSTNTISLSLSCILSSIPRRPLYVTAVLFGNMALELVQRATTQGFRWFLEQVRFATNEKESVYRGRLIREPGKRSSCNGRFISCLNRYIGLPSCQNFNFCYAVETCGT